MPLLSRQFAIETLVATYARLNRLGVLRVPPVQSLFVRSYMLYKRYLEDPFADLVASRPEMFQRGDVIDVGANIGYTAMVFARALADGYRVWAFEPERANFSRLVKHLHDFGVEEKVMPQALAVGARGGSVDIWRNDAHHADHRIATPTLRDHLADGAPVYRVPMTTLDAFVELLHIADQVGFIKIDVQGYEAEVCAGMTRTLELNPEAVVAVEYEPQASAELGFEPGAVPRFFRDRGYRLYDLQRRGVLRPVSAEDLESTKAEGLNLLCSRRAL